MILSDFYSEHDKSFVKKKEEKKGVSASMDIWLFWASLDFYVTPSSIPDNSMSEKYNLESQVSWEKVF